MAGLCAALLPAWAGAALAGEPGEVSEKRSDLEKVERRLRDLKKEIAGTEELHTGATKVLADAERAVSHAERELRRVAAQLAEVDRSLVALEAERQDIEQRVAARQTELGQWLRRHYMHRGAESVAPFLAARDPNQIARDAHYLEHLGKARLELITALRADLRQKADVGERIIERRDRLAGLEAEQRKQHAALQSVHEKRRKALAALSDQLRTQRKAQQTLEQDHQRLGRLIEVLVKQAAERERARLAAARAAEAARAATARKAESGRSARDNASREAAVGQVRAVAGPTPTGVTFAQLRGKLRFPVRGELVGRFGAPRVGSGTSWRGVFIRAASGEDVRAVARGEVVFSDWLRGYGNLIIVDHGGDYLSVYGNNDALLKELGDVIGGGDAIASVGASGGGLESGLYFEIRHRGQPVDPLQWVRLD